DGTVSSAPDAVGPYEFLDDRILNAAELFGSFMVGIDIPWVPTASHTDAYGNPTVVYKSVSWNYRGRTSSQAWELYYYYKYTRGVNMEQRAPNFSRFFDKRTGYNWDSGDGGGDFWLFIPAQAEAEGTQHLVKPVVDPLREVEVRFTALDANSVVMNDDATGYIRVTAAPEGSKLAVFGYGSAGTQMGFRIRSNGLASMDVYGTTYALPDTQGQWKYVLVPGGLGDFLPLTVTGNGASVDIDHVNIKADTLLSAPAFTAGSADLTVYTYAGSTLTTSLDFGATDPQATDVLSYKANNLPQGASFNTATGAFSWKPTQAGTYALIIEASDGTTVTLKRVNIVVGADRRATIDAVTAPYNPSTLYVQSTLNAYTAAYNDLAGVIGSASDTVFFDKLANLRTLVGQLQQLTPLVSDDGSMNITNMLWQTTWNAGQLVDNHPETSVNFSEAKNYGLLLDFGPSFKVSASKFRLQAVLSFPERGGGIAILGSNDNENWTRLTPGMTGVVDDMQELTVQDDLKNNRYRFLKIQMVQPTSNLLQLGEFHIFGQRYETVNKLSSTTMGSAQALRTRVIVGDTITLSFRSTEPINTVSATLQGAPATIATTDNLNWTASVQATPAMSAGPVKFLLNYKTQDGLAAEPTFLLTSGTALWISDQTNFIANLLDITSQTDSSNRNATDVRTSANTLFDRDITSGTDLRVNGSGSGGWLSFDFRGGGTAALSRVEIIGKQDQYYTRINGAVVQGSNDYSSWTTISNAAGASVDWQTLTINNPTPFRYIRIYNGNTWYGNMTELRLYGVVASTNKIATTSISSAQALRRRIVPGNTVTVSFTTKEAVSNIAATIDDQAATISATGNLSYTATATLPQGVAAGAVKFAINYTTQDGKAGFTGVSTTDGTSLFLVNEADTIKNVTGIATLIDSTQGRSAANVLANANRLFDSNLSSATDLRTGTSNGAGGYLIFDFKAGNQVNLSNVEVAGNQDQYYTRINGLVIQGSNDQASWTTLTGAAVASMEWQTLAVGSLTPYRYIRIYNPNTWFGTMTELRLHGTVHGADTTAPVTSAAAPQGTVNTDTTVSFTAADNQGGSGVAATYYKVDDGAQQSGSAVTLTTSGTHKVNFWSVDWAGNAEAPKQVMVTLDKFTDVSSSVAISRSGLTMNRFTNKYTGTVTITNAGAQTVAGPLRLRLLALSAGVTLDNQSGQTDGVSWITLPVTDLAAGQSVTLTTTFSNPNKVGIAYTPQLVSLK
ncbi:MAG: discoidin domain-containing protein, partial [Massilia sp.]